MIRHRIFISKILMEPFSVRPSPCSWSLFLQHLIPPVHCVVDIQKDSAACRPGSQCKNQDRLKVVIHSRRRLWARRLSQGDNSLLHFARRHPSISSTGASFGQNSADEPLFLADFSASAAPPEGATQIGITSQNTSRISPAQAPVTGESVMFKLVCAAICS